MGMFGKFFEEEKLSCVFVELTPIEQIKVAALCCWVDHYLHLSPHTILILLVYLHLVDQPIDQSVVVAVVIQNTSIQVCILLCNWALFFKC